MGFQSLARTFLYKKGKKMVYVAPALQQRDGTVCHRQGMTGGALSSLCSIESCITCSKTSSHLGPEMNVSV